MRYDKLVRDKIPEIIRSNGNIPVTDILDDDCYNYFLNLKLKEELSEYLGSSSTVNATEELADLVEVIYAILEFTNISIEEFEAIRAKKRNEKGGFRNRIYLKETL